MYFCALRLSTKINLLEIYRGALMLRKRLDLSEEGMLFLFER